MLTSSGSNFRVGPVNFYRAIQNRTPEGIAAAVALTFMGARAEAWPTRPAWRAWRSSSRRSATSPPASGRRKSSSGTRSTRSAPGHRQCRRQSTAARACRPTARRRRRSFPTGSKIKLPPDRDPREVFADWLITPKNPWFTRNIANRVWAWLLGRGIIHEPDDIRDDNPPSNPALLAYLEKELVASHYDLKHLYRLILNSETYQFSSVPRSNGRRRPRPISAATRCAAWMRRC